MEHLQISDILSEYVSLHVKVSADLAVVGHDNSKGDFPSVIAFIVKVLWRFRPPKPHILFIKSHV
jgi:hypothetical protein